MAIRDGFQPRPGPALIEGHFWVLAHRGLDCYILAQVRYCPEKDGTNSTLSKDWFRLRSGLAKPRLGLVEGHFGSNHVVLAEIT